MLERSLTIVFHQTVTLFRVSSCPAGEGRVNESYLSYNIRVSHILMLLSAITENNGSVVDMRFY